MLAVRAEGDAVGSGQAIHSPPIAVAPVGDHTGQCKRPRDGVARERRERVIFGVRWGHNVHVFAIGAGGHVCRSLQRYWLNRDGVIFTGRIHKHKGARRSLPYRASGGASIIE
eukprot:scaffold22_cov329-Pinguiococcus_pyrenoidosus.AAC.3